MGPMDTVIRKNLPECGRAQPSYENIMVTDMLNMFHFGMEKYLKFCYFSNMFSCDLELKMVCESSRNMSS